MGLFGLFGKDKKESLNKGLEKTKESVFKKLARAVVGKSKVDDEVLDNLEEVLITSDVGVETTVRIIERIEERVRRDKYMGVDELNQVLKEEIVDLLKENNKADVDAFDLPAGGGPYVIMVVGVNKNTSLFTVTNLKTNSVVLEEIAPIQFEAKKVILTLKENPQEYFYGGNQEVRTV